MRQILPLLCLGPPFIWPCSHLGSHTLSVARAPRFKPWSPRSVCYIEKRSLNSYTPISSQVYIWFWLAYITHLTWEPAWMFMHRDFKSQLDSVWIFGFSAYFPGDDRYLNPDNSVYIIETLSICNGIIVRTKKRHSFCEVQSCHLLLFARCVKGMHALYLWNKDTQVNT